MEKLEVGNIYFYGNLYYAIEEEGGSLFFCMFPYGRYYDSKIEDKKKHITNMCEEYIHPLKADSNNLKNGDVCRVRNFLKDDWLDAIYKDEGLDNKVACLVKVDGEEMYSIFRYCIIGGSHESMGA